MSESARDYAKLKAVLEQVADELPEARKSIVNDLLKDEPVLCERVLKMLGQSASEQNFLESSLPELISFAPEPDSTSPAVADDNKRPPGSEVGPFTLERVLGEGGMGVVYLAHQQQPVKREVALKLISLHATGTSSPQISW